MVLVVASACGGPSAVELAVDLRTDYVPGVEFATVRVALVDEGRSEEAPAGTGDYLSGQRVAELEGLTPQNRRALEVELVDASGRVIARRQVLVRHAADLAVTLVMTRDCRDVTCPVSAGSPATSCLGGECVDPTCVEGDEETCAPACSVDADCQAMAACARPICSSGVCLYGADDSCAADAYCDASAGCVPLEPSTCAPTLDVTYELLTGTDDGEGLSARPRDVALAFDGDEPWLAFSTIASPDLADIGSIYVAPLRCDGTFGDPEMLIFDAVRPSIALAAGRLLVGCQPHGNFVGSEAFRFVDPDTGLPLGPAVDPDGIGAIDGVIPNGQLFDVLTTERIDVGDERVHVFTLDGDGAIVGERYTPMAEAGTAEQEYPVGAPAAGGSAVAFLRSLPDGALGLADGVIVDAPFTDAVTLDTDSPRTGVLSLGLVVQQGVAWVTVREGPNSTSTADQITSLHSVSASGTTRHELPAAPAGAADYGRGLVQGPPGQMLYIWMRGHDSDPSALFIRRLDVEGEAVTVGPERLVPTIEPVTGLAAVHVGAGTYLMAWSEGVPRGSGTLRARFVQP